MGVGIEWGLLVYFFEDGFCFLSGDLLGVSYELILLLINFANAFLEGSYKLRPDMLELACQKVAILILGENH
jgi:hypothetical protein